jgi:hypothetical protein
VRLQCARILMKINVRCRIRLQSCGRSDLLSHGVHPKRWRRGKFQEWFQLNGEWIAMPAFTFEKISPPARRTPNVPADKKRRSVIGQVLDRFSAKRGKPGPRKEQGPTARQKPKA